MKTARTSLLEVIAGIWIFAGVVILAGVFFVANPLAYVLGEIVGSLTATLMMIHLYRSLDIEMNLSEKKAVNHSRLMSIVRNLLELAVLAGSFYISQWVMPYTVFAGMLGRKAAALCVPLYENRKRGNTKSGSEEMNGNKADTE